MLPILLLLSAAVTAEADHAWDIPRVAHAPVLDGRLDDDCWNAFPPGKDSPSEIPAPALLRRNAPS